MTIWLLVIFPMFRGADSVFGLEKKLKLCVMTPAVGLTAREDMSLSFHYSYNERKEAEKSRVCLFFLENKSVT